VKEAFLEAAYSLLANFINETQILKAEPD